MLSTTRSTRQVLPSLVCPSLFTNSNMTSFCICNRPNGWGCACSDTRTHLSFSPLGRRTALTMLYLFTPVSCWHAAIRPLVGTDFNTLLQFWAALSQPVDIKGMIESFHRLPRSKSLEISWSFPPFGLFKNVQCHDVVGNSAMLPMLLKFIA
jgi:hypothetical protein